MSPGGGSLNLTGKGNTSFELPSRMKDFTYDVLDIPGVPGSTSPHTNVIYLDLLRKRRFLRSSWTVTLAWDLISPKAIVYSYK